MSTYTSEVHCDSSWLISSTHFAFSLLTFISQPIECVMFRMVLWYDIYMYTPLQIYLSPYMDRIPRFIQIGNKTITVFNANIITYSRTFLIIPIAWCLKYDYAVVACLLVFFHDFLDHIDGIVAKVQRRRYGENIDDPLLGGFMDAFCDKIVNVVCLWTILQETHFHQTSFFMSLAFILLCYTIIALETVIGVIRVQDYFAAALGKNKMSSQGSTSASMEGKLKETLESTGLSFLCLSTAHLSPFDHWSGIAGIICFALTIRLAYASLMLKLQAREASKAREKTVRIDLLSTSPVQKTIEMINVFNSSTDTKSCDRPVPFDTLMQKNEKRKCLHTPPCLSSSITGSISSITNDQTPSIPSKGAPNPFADHFNGIKEECKSTLSSGSQKESLHVIQRSSSVPAIWIDSRADKVYTIGCFDLFHEGHRLLLERMRHFGREVIVGVHDSRSIHKLKSRVPVDGTETRMQNVKLYADQVYCVAGTDPSSFITCVVHLRENETAVYVRGDDMADFPSKRVVEVLMPVKFVPYTNGISSTKLRQELFSHIKPDDMEHLEMVN